jgi:putative sigma-54 modulation protein
VNLQVKGRNVEVNETIRAYAEAKLGKLDRTLADGARVELELWVERNPSIAANQVAEATIWSKGPVLRAREASADMKASIDQLVDKLERQVTRYRRKRRSRSGRRGAAAAEQPASENESGEGPTIVKTKQFAVKPMTPEEAVLELELIGHDFFVFRNADTNEVNVLYRRRDGAYGLIEPE